ncbi:hypothetical protein [Parafrankia sp. FMc2]|uniref:hypothetical protein n=1 Tax=Parafrankia sp. FMc2 TaxID=3233196 RepID=UPI0034D7A9A3
MIELDDAQAQRLGAAVRRRRRELRDPPQAEIALRGEISVATFQKLEGGTPGRYQPRTLDKLDRGLRWPAGTAERVILGGSPLSEDQPQPVIQEFVDDAGVIRRRVIVEDMREQVELPEPSELVRRITDTSDADLTQYVLGRLLALEPARRKNLLVAFARMLDAVEGS